jgi:DNA-binding GntR family transcriptional regulator
MVMMREPLATGERIYLAVKGRLLSGVVLPGDRLDARRMAELHAASITPVRAALHRLVGEGLVVNASGEGFHTPRVSEASLRDLYEWSSRCLQSAWQLAVLHDLSPLAAYRRDRADVREVSEVSGRTAELFAQLGICTGNEQCTGAIAALNDRLKIVRTQEVRLFADAIQEWSGLVDLFARARPGSVLQAIAAYHRRRNRAAADLVSMIYRQN